MEKVVVTGSTGFIGRNLVPALEKQGFEVIQVHRDFAPIECSRVYHLACPSSTTAINTQTLHVMDTILDATRAAMKICPSAKFINASSKGALEIIDTEQGAYNVAKRCMEMYLKFSELDYINYRIPSVYGEGMPTDGFISRCVNGTAYYPPEPDKTFWIAHVSEVVDALVNLRPIVEEETTLGQVYEQFNSRRRGLHWPASST